MIFFDQVFDGLIVHGVRLLQHFAKLFAHGAFGHEVAILQGLQDGFLQRFHRTAGIHFGHAVVLRLEAALHKEIAETLDEIFEIDSVRGFLRRIWRI